jgi:nitrate/TMAO reductase-like tetraheme cytochrome c subunit
MSEENLNPEPPRFVSFRNWVSLTGVVIAGGALFSFVLLFVLDTLAKSSNPYVGILTWFVAPGFLFFGLGLTLFGMWRYRRRYGKLSAAPRLQIDLSRPRDRKALAFFGFGAVGFLLLSAVGSYHTYHFTESVTFCGQACHTVMEPEMVTYHNGPHARVACVECHIGPGAEWFVKAKISGSYQLYSVAFDKYPRPVPTPVHNLRPARDTCERCHWPQKFVGDFVRNYDYYLSDETNSHHAIQLLLKVGGADARHGPVDGIHWHINPGHKIEYLATDDKRLKIPWVRMTDTNGQVTEFRTKSFTNDISQYEIRTMDCVDCHNRPAHRYKSPSDAVNLAMANGKIDPTLKWMKTNAVFVLTREYTNKTEALTAIETTLQERYPNEPRVVPAIAALQDIYTNNFFPEMRASWKAYPEHIGHKDWPGCARCHDDMHIATDGSKKKIGFSNCSTCHVIQAQGTGKQLEQLSAKGHPFAHPVDEYPDGYLCTDCHAGGN